MARATSTIRQDYAARVHGVAPKGTRQDLCRSREDHLFEGGCVLCYPAYLLHSLNRAGCVIGIGAPLAGCIALACTKRARVPRDTVQYTLVSAAEKRALLVGMIRVDSVEYEEGKLLLINSYYNEDAAAAAHSPVLRALAVSKQTRLRLRESTLDYTASHVRWRRAGTGRLARPCGAVWVSLCSRS